MSLLTHDENANQNDPFLVTESNTLKKKKNRAIVDSIITPKTKKIIFLKNKNVSLLEFYYVIVSLTQPTLILYNICKIRVETSTTTKKILL